MEKHNENERAWKARGDLARALRNVEDEMSSGCQVVWWRTAAAHQVPDLITALLLATAGYRITASGLRWSADGEDELPEVEQVKASMGFILTNMTTTARICCASNSYGLKHRVERWARATGHSHAARGGGYVSNGAFIVAALLLGAKMEPTCYGSPNVYVALRLSSRGRQ